MKKQLLLIPMVAGLLLAGCQKETPLQNPSSAGQVSETFDLRTGEISIHEQVGIMHNLYVEAYYNELNAKVNQIGYNALNPSHVRTAFRKSVTDDVNGNNQLRNYFKGEFNTVQSLQNPTEIRAYLTDKINNSNFSDAFKTWSINFMNTASGLTKDEDIAALIQQGKREALAFTGIERDVVLASVYTFQYSVEYWAVNSSKWENLVDPNDEVQNQTKASYGAADMGGAAAGGTAGALIGGTATIGTLTAPGWAVGAVVGGVSSTIGQAVSDFWEWLWS